MKPKKYQKSYRFTFCLMESDIRAIKAWKRKNKIKSTGAAVRMLMAKSGVIA